MCFHGNQHPSSIKYPFISLYSKYHPFIFICLLNMNSPVFPSLDDIYCIYGQLFFGFFFLFFVFASMLYQPFSSLNKGDKKPPLVLTLLNQEMMNFPSNKLWKYFQSQVVQKLYVSIKQDNFCWSPFFSIKYIKHLIRNVKIQISPL